MFGKWDVNPLSNNDDLYEGFGYVNSLLCLY